MGIYYKLWLRDDFDWDYKGYSKDQLRKDIVKQWPISEIVADFNNWLIVDIGKTLPLEEDIVNLKYDNIMVSRDNEMPTDGYI